MNFPLTWPMRPGSVPVAVPNSLLAMLPTTPLKLAWLKMLKNSPRIIMDILSLMAMLFDVPKSVLMMPGPWKKRTAALPSCPTASAAKEFGRKYVFGPFGPALRGF